MKQYNKLVRDKIPEILDGLGKKYEIEKLSHQELGRKLLEKLVEEAREVEELKDGMESNPRDSIMRLVTELADTMEVLEAILEHFGIDKRSLKFNQKLRREKRGGFKEGILLKSAEE